MKHPIARTTLIAVMLTSVPGATPAATVVTLNTGVYPFTSGSLSQGWWSDFAANTANNDNYVVSLSWTAASYPAQRGIRNRNFFTFDLSDIAGTIQSATLLLARGNSLSPNATETLSFWDVQTTTSQLNYNQGINPAIVNDLGAGKNYGYFPVVMSGAPSQVLSFALNENAVADLNARVGGFFSIGGSMEGEPAAGVYRVIFGVTQGIAGRLQLVLVPEPAVGGLLLFGGCISLVARKRVCTARG